MSINILHLSTSNQWGGTQQRIFILSKMLNDSQVKTFVALPPGGILTKKLKEIGAETIPFKLNNRWDIRTIIALRKMLSEKRIDILHVHRSKEHFVGFWAVNWFSKNRVRLIRTKHDNVPITNNLANYLLYSRFTDKLITVGEDIKTKAVNDNHLKSSHIVTIPSSVLIDKFNPEIVSSSKFRKSLSIAKDVPLIGTIGKIHPMKDYITFLRACRLIKDSLPKAKFLWVGDGTYEKKAKIFTQRLKLKNSVIFTGRRNDIPEILADLDVFVLSSKSEGSPAVIKEALLMKKPVVATKVGAIPEIIKNKDIGELVFPEKPEQLAEAVIKILNNPIRKKIGEKGRNFIKDNFSESVLAEKTKKVYWDLLRFDTSQKRKTKNKEKLDVSPWIWGGEVKHVQLIKRHENRVIWKASISFPSYPEQIIIKAIRPINRNRLEIKLYKINPYILRSFLPEIYDVKRNQHLYWFLMEKLEPTPTPKMSMEFFKKPIELLASLHSKFYSKFHIIRDPKLNWVSDFKRENSRRMDERWLTHQIQKNRRYPKVYGFLRENEKLCREVFSQANEALETLMPIPYSIIHGEPVYHHILYSAAKKNCQNMKLIDWSNISFAPVTFDLYFLIDKTFYHKVNPEERFEEDYILKGINKNKELISFRNDCLRHYCKVIKNHGTNINEEEFQNWYNLTYTFKTTRYLFWKNFKKYKTKN